VTRQASADPHSVHTLFEHAASGASAPVTVCVSLHQYADYIVECLESVRAQTLDDVSLIVVDDHSRDGGERRVHEWLKAHGGRFASAELLRHERNLGLAPARNTAIGRARSPYVFVLDADNGLYPRALERLYAVVEETGAPFAYSILERFGDEQGLLCCEDWSRERLAQGNYIDAMALLRRSTWEAVGGYRQMRFSGWEDYDFWCRCAEAGLDGRALPEILCRYRVHSRSMRRSATDTLREHLALCDEMREAHPWIAF
jgi:glycosyltransferase involved in cell wall biosynthesis